MQKYVQTQNSVQIVVQSLVQLSVQNFMQKLARKRGAEVRAGHFAENRMQHGLDVLLRYEYGSMVNHRIIGVQDL